MDNTPKRLFFDSGESRSYLSKKFYDANMSVHRLPKFVSTCKGIKIGNGSIIPALFVIPVQLMTNGHIFEIYVVHPQNRLLSRQLRPTFPPAWRE